LLIGNGQLSIGEWGCWLVGVAGVLLLFGREGGYGLGGW
jgi:hypothetical protein